MKLLGVKFHEKKEFLFFLVPPVSDFAEQYNEGMRLSQQSKTTIVKFLNRNF